MAMADLATYSKNKPVSLSEISSKTKHFFSIFRAILYSFERGQTS